MDEEIPEILDSDFDSTPNKSVQMENEKPSSRPTTIGLQPVEHRIEIGPIDDIFRIKSLSRAIAKNAPGLSLCLSSSKTGIKPTFNLLSRPMPENEATGIASILDSQYPNLTIRRVQTHQESFAEESVPTVMLLNSSWAHQIYFRNSKTQEALETSSENLEAVHRSKNSRA